MAKVTVYNQMGDKVSEQELADKIFNVEINPAVVQQVVTAQMANSRVAIASTKDRSEVRGGGRKPWRQKGTGRARHGSSRSPIWRHGGITFGPTSQRNFSQKVNKKMKRKALAMTLTDKVAENYLIALDKLELAEVKTKKFNEVLKQLKLRSDKKAASKDGKTKTSKKESSILIVLDKKDEKVSRSARNLARVSTINAGSLNVVDLLKHQYVVATVAALKKIEEVFAK